MTKKNRITTFLLVLVVILAIGGELLLSLFAVRADAAVGTSTTYSNVLDDLKKDSSFNPADYPDKSDDYSLSVIQVAEGENGELFVYVYQPNFAYSKLKASYINLSTEDSRTTKSITYKRKSLTFLNSNGSLCKYLVNDFEVTEDTIRYYSVAAIYRPYIEGKDIIFEAIDEKNHVAYEVGRMWAAAKYNDVLTYKCFKIKTVPVTITASGEIYYSGGYLLHLGGCHSHYFAFNVPGYNVTEIFDADVTYNLIPYYHTTYLAPAVDSTREVIRVDTETLYQDELVSYEGDGFNSYSYSWERIQTIEEFFSEAEEYDYDFSESEIEGLNAAQFVFRIAESAYNETVNWNTAESVATYYKLEDSGVLRLHFATPDGVYNLGAVSDLVGSDGVADGNVSYGDNLKKNFEEIGDSLRLIITIVIGIFLYLVLRGPIKAFFKLIWSGIKFIFNLIVKLIYCFFWIITWPLRQLFK